MTNFTRGDRISHVDHGKGQIIEVFPSGNLDVVFPAKDNPELPASLYTILPVETLDDAVTLLPRPETPLTKMVEKLDNRPPDTRGYVAYRPEVVEILNSLSENVPFNVFGGDEFGGDIRIEIKGSFTLERDLL